MLLSILSCKFFWADTKSINWNQIPPPLPHKARIDWVANQTIFFFPVEYAMDALLIQWQKANIKNTYRRNGKDGYDVSMFTNIYTWEEEDFSFFFDGNIHGTWCLLSHIYACDICYNSCATCYLVGALRHDRVKSFTWTQLVAIQFVLNI